MNNQTLIAIAGAGALGIGILLWQAPARQQAVSAAPEAGPPTSTSTRGGERRILYYRNPMGLPDTSPVPKVDQMGMDYLPVYAGEESTGTVRIDSGKLQKLGVRTEAAAVRVLTQTLRIVGTLQADESLQSTLSPRFEGWITRVLVSSTGASVTRGQPVLEVYSPDLLAAQQEYRIAMQARESLAAGDAGARSSMNALAQASLERLRNWGIADEDLDALRTGQTPERAITLRAPRAGVITEKTARAGMRFMPGEPLYQIADLSRVWLIGSVFEQDLALVRIGARVRASVLAYPGQVFTGTVSFVSPLMQAETRTAQVRIALANPRGLLKPAMYGSVELAAGSQRPRLAVPESAILDTGTRQLVLVDRGAGQFEPRTVLAGVHADGYTEILGGVAAGEAVVVNGNFLIDSESNLRSAISGLAPGGPPAAAQQPGH